MLGLDKFFVYMGAALLVFVVVLTFSVRHRGTRPVGKILLLSLVAVVGGMTFARLTYSRGLPWWVFYGVPAVVTFLLPPPVLRMSGREFLRYEPLAVLMAPAIHIFFSFCFGWHDYMPLFYMQSWWELFNRASSAAL